MRFQILESAYIGQEGHVPSAFSVLEILNVLYREILGSDDKFILSKGHASMALYAVLSKHGLISDSWHYNFASFSSNFGGHPDSTKIPGVYCSTGSLGHGFPFSVGMALAKKVKKEPGQIYCLIGDGEANEGTTWESALLAPQHSLNNLTCVIDNNQSSDRALKLGNLFDKFKSFGWRCIHVDGHSEKLLFEAFREKSQEPTLIIANTIKGFGISEMENNPAWHHTKISQDNLLNFKKELGI